METMEVDKMVRQIISLILLAFSTVGHSQIITDTLYDEKGNIEAYGNLKDGKRDGTWYFHFQNNKSYKQILYENKEKVIVKYYSDDDFTNVIELDAMNALPYNISNNQFYLTKYIEGCYDPENYSVTFNGKYYAYHPNGNISSRGHYKNGKFDGEFIINYQGGQRMNLITFSEGVLNGKWITYYEAPYKQIRVKGEYNKDSKYGTWEEYYPNGQLKHEGKYNHDISAIYISDNNIDSLQNIYPDVKFKYYKLANLPFNFKSGCWKYYSEDGKLIRKEEYKLGRLVVEPKE